MNLGVPIAQSYMQNKSIASAETFLINSSLRLYHMPITYPCSGELDSTRIVAYAALTFCRFTAEIVVLCRRLCC